MSLEENSTDLKKAITRSILSSLEDTIERAVDEYLSKKTKNVKETEKKVLAKKVADEAEKKILTKKVVKEEPPKKATKKVVQEEEPEEKVVAKKKVVKEEPAKTTKKVVQEEEKTTKKVVKEEPVKKAPVARGKKPSLGKCMWIPKGGDAEHGTNATNEINGSTYCTPHYKQMLKANEREQQKTEGKKIPTISQKKTTTPALEMIAKLSESSKLKADSIRTTPKKLADGKVVHADSEGFAYDKESKKIIGKVVNKALTKSLSDADRKYIEQNRIQLADGVTFSKKAKVEVVSSGSENDDIDEDLEIDFDLEGSDDE